MSENNRNSKFRPASSQDLNHQYSPPEGSNVTKDGRPGVLEGYDNTDADSAYGNHEEDNITPGILEGFRDINDSEEPKINRDELSDTNITNNYNITKKYKVVFQIGDSDNWEKALASARALYDGLGQRNVHIVFVVVQKAVKTLIDKEKENTDIMDSIKATLAHNSETIAADILALASSGVEFIA